MKNNERTKEGEVVGVGKRICDLWRVWYGVNILLDKMIRKMSRIWGVLVGAKGVNCGTFSWGR
jgi:hypothetical protein